MRRNRTAIWLLNLAVALVTSACGGGTEEGDGCDPTDFVGFCLNTEKVICRESTKTVDHYGCCLSCRGSSCGCRETDDGPRCFCRSW